MKNILLASLCLASLSACTTTPAPTQTEYNLAPIPRMQPEAVKKLQNAEDRWQKKHPKHYIYTLQRTCFCPKEYNNPIEIRVLNDFVQQANLPLDGEPMPANRMDEALTIKDLFAIIHKAVDKKAAKIDIKYNWQYGYPTKIDIDWDKMMADEETYFTINEFRPQ